MKLYDFSTAPNPRKVRLFIAEKQLDVPIVHVDLRAGEQFRPEFRAKNPDATLPLLELDDGTRMTESLAICSYLEGLHPHPPLMGTSPLERAMVLMWNDIATLQGYIPLQDVLRNRIEAYKDRALPGPEAYAQIPELVERGRKRAELFFDRLDRRLGESAHLAGDAFTYADIASFVYTGFAQRVLKKDVTEGRPHLGRWYQEIAERPAVKGLD